MRIALLLFISCCTQAAPNVPSVPQAPSQPAAPSTPQKAPPPVVAQKSCDPFEPRSPAPSVFIGPTGVERKLIELIGSAHRSLDVLMYELETQSLLDAFVAAKARGVAVRLVLDRNHNDSSSAKLTDAGISWHPSPQEFAYAHSKTLLIDDATSVIMSLNMNRYSLQSERNYAMVSSDAGDAQDLKKVFEADWAATPGAVDLSCSRLVVSPINARARLGELIASTTDTLDFAVMYLSDAAFMRAVLARKAAGVTVRVLLADPEWIDGNADTAAALVTAGIEAKYFTTFDLHAKLIISDDRAFVGSENMSSNSLDNNREVGVFISNSEQVRTIRTQFEADWAAGAAVH